MWKHLIAELIDWGLSDDVRRSISYFLEITHTHGHLLHTKLGANGGGGENFIQEIFSLSFSSSGL